MKTPCKYTFLGLYHIYLNCKLQRTKRSINTYVMIVLFSSNMQCVVVVSGNRPDVSTVLQQQHSNINVSESRRNMKWRLPLASLGFYRCSVSQ